MAQVQCNANLAGGYRIGDVVDVDLASPEGAIWQRRIDSGLVTRLDPPQHVIYGRAVLERGAYPPVQTGGVVTSGPSLSEDWGWTLDTDDDGYR